MTERILRRRQVQERVPVATSTLYDWIAKGFFPKPVALGGSRAVGWRQSEVDAWLAARAPRDQNAA